jgi:type IV secretion system protein VirD4
LQGLSQLKALYKDTWEGIISNCSLFTFLGTNDLESKKYVVEKLGKTTVRLETKSHSQSNTGGSTSNNEQYDSRDLVTVDELPKILKKNSRFGGSCILFIDEFSPFYRPKFNTKNHPKSHLTGSSFADGIPNNTDIIKVYGNKIKPPKPPKCDVRKLIEDIEDFENGEEFLQMSEFEGDLLDGEEDVKKFTEGNYE